MKNEVIVKLTKAQAKILRTFIGCISPRTASELIVQFSDNPNLRRVKLLRRLSSTNALYELYEQLGD